MFCKARRVAGLLTCQDFWPFIVQGMMHATFNHWFFYLCVLTVADDDVLISILIGRVWGRTCEILVMHSGVSKFRFHFRDMFLVLFSILSGKCSDSTSNVALTTSFHIHPIHYSLILLHGAICFEIATKL
jgi:hypothetical protein